jgi:hypothetical protein
LSTLAYSIAATAKKEQAVVGLLESNVDETWGSYQAMVRSITEFFVCWGGVKMLPKTIAFRSSL